MAGGSEIGVAPQIEHRRPRRPIGRWLALPVAAFTVLLGLLGASLAAKAIDPASGGCTAAVHEDTGNWLLYAAFFLFSPIAVISATAALVRGPTRARWAGLAAIVVVVVLCVYIYARGYDGDFYCSRH
jgi:uncharacterized membrane protein